MMSEVMNAGAAFSPLRVLFPLPPHLHLSKLSVFLFVIFHGCYQLEEGPSMHGNSSCIPVTAARGCCRTYNCLRP